MAVLSPSATFLFPLLLAKAVRIAAVRFCGRTANASSAEGGVWARTTAEVPRAGRSACGCAPVALKPRSPHPRTRTEGRAGQNVGDTAAGDRARWRSYHAGARGCRRLRAARPAARRADGGLRASGAWLSALPWFIGKLHKSGLVHKDIKPFNILLNRTTGEVKLTGFGIASRLPREHQAPDPPETIAGTLAYMAPNKQDG